MRPRARYDKRARADSGSRQCRYYSRHWNARPAFTRAADGPNPECACAASVHCFSRNAHAFSRGARAFNPGVHTRTGRKTTGTLDVSGNTARCRLDPAAATAARRSLPSRSHH